MAPDGMALFMKRSDSGEWSIPAGGIEAGEEPLHAAQREAAEETGYPGDAAIRKIDRRTTNGVDFRTYQNPVAEPFEPLMNEEHTDYLWAPLDDPPEPLHPGLGATLGALNRAGLVDYHPDQPREPAGSPGGGRWTSGGGGGDLTVEHAKPSAYFQRGDRVKVKSGPHTGAIGMVGNTLYRPEGALYFVKFDTPSGKRIGAGFTGNKLTRVKHKFAPQNEIDLLKASVKAEIENVKPYDDTISKITIHPTSSEGSALDWYQQDPWINQYLRTGHLHWESAATPEEAEQVAEVIDKAIANRTTDAPLTLWRGFGDKNPDDFAKNGVIRHKGFVSTSVDETAARQFAKAGNYIAKIELPAGSHAVAIDYGKDPASQANSYEKEVLLARGSRFRIVGIDHGNKTVSLQPINDLEIEHTRPMTVGSVANKVVDPEVLAAYKAGWKPYAAAMLAKCKLVAASMNVDPAKVSVSLDTQKGGMGTVMASTNDATGDVVMFARYCPPEIFAGVLAHELNHVKYKQYRIAYKAERDAVETELTKSNLLQMMNADGTLNEPLASKYPIYQQFTLLYDVKKLREEDGVSQYSTAWWHKYDQSGGKHWSSSAVYETLAEMSRKFLETGELQGGPRFQGLYYAVRSFWHEKKPKGYYEP